MSRYIGEGGYGCVYRSPICSTPLMKRDRHDYVGKLSLARSGGIKRELAVAQSLNENSNIDWSLYFGLLLGDSCQPTEEEYRQVGEECSYISGREHRVKRTSIRSYPSLYLGISLTDYKEEVSAKWIWDSFKHLLHGISFLHSNDIYHLDIKAGNILVDEHGVCRIIDFGLALVEPTPADMTDLISTYYDVYPLFFNLFVDQNSDASDPNSPDRDRYYKSYEYLIKGYYPNYQRNTASDPIALGFCALDLGEYGSTIVFPNLGKVDLYELAMVFNNMLGDYKSYSDRDITRPLYKPHINKIIIDCINVDVNRQLTVKAALDYVNSAI